MLIIIILIIVVIAFMWIKRKKNSFNYPISIPLSNGKYIDYINFDSAASTLPFSNIMNKLITFSPYYSNIHRGAGYCSVVSTNLY